mmetsp:Transcript_107764/g.304660  ORF Transcript_107764/g.304660 Transcript_107764/m.304660 type:complete len:297 (+) Transcript_107764:74-964(+)
MLPRRSAQIAILGSRRQGRSELRHHKWVARVLAGQAQPSCNLSSLTWADFKQSKSTLHLVPLHTLLAGKGTLHFASPRGGGCDIYCLLLLETRHTSLLGGANGGYVRAPGGHNRRLLILRHLEDLARELRGGLDAALLHHAHHLVAHNLAPVRPVLVGVHDSDLLSLHVVHYNCLLAQHPSGHSAVSTLHARLRLVNGAVLHIAGVDDGDALADELVRADDQAEGGQGARVVLDEHAVEHAHGPAAGHFPPCSTVLGHLPVHVQEAVLAVGDVAIVGRVEGIAGARLVDLEELLAC